MLTPTAKTSKLMSRTMQPRAHRFVALLFATAIAATPDLSNLDPDLAELVEEAISGPGDTHQQTADDDDDPARISLLNECSVCEAGAHAAAGALWRLSRQRAKDAEAPTTSAFDAMQDACATVEGGDYGLVREAKSRGLLGGPAIGASRGKVDSKSDGALEAVSKLRAGCEAMLADVNAEELYATTVGPFESIKTRQAESAEQKAVQKKRVKPSIKAKQDMRAILNGFTLGAFEVQKRLCDGASAPCGKYTLAFPSPKLGAMRRMAHGGSAGGEAEAPKMAASPPVKEEV